MKKVNLTLANFDNDNNQNYVYMNEESFGFSIFVNDTELFTVSKFFGFDDDGNLMEEIISCQFSLELAIDYINRAGFEEEKTNETKDGLIYLS